MQVRLDFGSSPTSVLLRLLNKSFQLNAKTAGLRSLSRFSITYDIVVGSSIVLIRN